MVAAGASNDDIMVDPSQTREAWPLMTRLRESTSATTP